MILRNNTGYALNGNTMAEPIPFHLALLVILGLALLAVFYAVSTRTPNRFLWIAAPVVVILLGISTQMNFIAGSVVATSALVAALVADFEMAESAVLLMLREQQKQKERAERKRLLYVALTRARDHLIMSGTAPDDPGLPLDLASSRIEWIFTALGITPDAVAAGGMDLALPDGTGPVRLSIVSDPAKIPAITGRVEPSLIVVPEECEGKTGTREEPEYDPGPARVKAIPVSELEQASGKSFVKSPAREPVVPKFLSGVPGTIRGTIIHEVLRGRDAATVLKEYGEFSDEHLWQCGEIREKFLASGLMKQADRSFCELPFVITSEGKHVNGKIDRLVELDDGSWAVIDYKSEAARPEEYAAAAEEYRVSMAVYGEAAKRLMPGKEVKEYLYFTETGKFFPVMSR